MSERTPLARMLPSVMGLIASMTGSIGWKAGSAQSIGTGGVEVYARLKSSREDRPYRGIRGDKLNNELHRTEIATTGSRYTPNARINLQALGVGIHDRSVI